MESKKQTCIDVQFDVFGSYNVEVTPVEPFTTQEVFEVIDENRATFWEDGSVMDDEGYEIGRYRKTQDDVEEEILDVQIEDVE